MQQVGRADSLWREHCAKLTRLHALKHALVDRTSSVLQAAGICPRARSGAKRAGEVDALNADMRTPWKIAQDQMQMDLHRVLEVTESASALAVNTEFSR